MLDTILAVIICTVEGVMLLTFLIFAFWDDAQRKQRRLDKALERQGFGIERLLPPVGSINLTEPAASDTLN